MTIYISGKIGEDEISEATRSKFLNAAQVLTREGYEPFNPCDDEWVQLIKAHYANDAIINSRMGRHIPDFYVYCLLNDMMAISCTMDGICILPDWESSPGAKVELAFAMATGKKVFELTNEGEIKEKNYHE